MGLRVDLMDLKMVDALNGFGSRFKFGVHK